MNDTLKEMLIMTAYQIFGYVLILWGVVSIADHLGWLGSFILMIVLLFAWSGIILLWRQRVKE